MNERFWEGGIGSIMLRRAFIVVLFLGLASTSFCRAKESKPEIAVRASDEKIDVYYGGKLRLRGGHFILHSKDITASDLIENGGVYSFETDENPVDVRAVRDGRIPVITFILSPNGNQSNDGRDFIGFFFDEIPGFEKGVTLWRYGPWNSWTRPIRVDSVSQMQGWDTQFFYWKYSDGIYGAAMPLSGRGYRTTVGQVEGAFGSESVNYLNDASSNDIPQMAVGFGDDPFTLFSTLYQEGLRVIGRSNDFIKGKRFPEVFDGIGWCTWNASTYGSRLNNDLLIESARNFGAAKFPMKWFLVDDGWFNYTDGKLNSFQPDSARFPGGFKPVIGKLKKEYHIDDVGVWHAFNGYWMGINPDSPLGKEFKNDLFLWKERSRPDIDTSTLRTGYFISPNSRALDRFYEEFHRYLKDQGFSFVKVDNQLITERMAPGNFPIFYGAEKYHQALNSSVARNFQNAVINCMDMTADAYLNFGTTAVARAEDDYWPEYDTLHAENYWLSRAGGHILQAVYNSLYFSQMVYPDFDMFESINPGATIYAMAHAINNGPVYITDKVDQHNFDVLWPLIYSDGKILRADKPLLPTRDCLFQVDEPKPFKAFSMDRATGLLGIWNCADSNKVEGFFKPSDVEGIKGKEFAVYEFFSKKMTIADRDEEIPVSLEGYGYKLYYIVPLLGGNAVLGLVNKYNAPAAVLSSRITGKEIQATVYEGGEFAVVVKSRPTSVKVNGKETSYSCTHNLLTLDIPLSEHKRHVKIEIRL